MKRIYLVGFFFLGLAFALDYLVHTIFTYYLWFGALKLFVLFFTGVAVFTLEWLYREKKIGQFSKLVTLLLAFLFISLLNVFFSGWYLLIWFVGTVFVLVYLDRVLGKLVKEKATKRPSEIEILDIHIDNETEKTAVEKIDEMIRGGGFHLIVTPYSEYIIDAQRDNFFKTTLNNADLSLPDGIFILWAAVYMSFPFSRVGIVRFFQVIFRYIFFGMCVVLYPDFVRTVIPDRVSGSDLIYPICKLAADKGYSTFFLGGFDRGRGNSGILAAEKLKKMYPGLKVLDVYPGNRKNEDLQEAKGLINKVNPDILLICINRGRGEKWAYENRQSLKCKLAIGLGGTFDFVSGYTQKVSPRIGHVGLEWFFRPFGKQNGGLTGNLVRAYRVWRGMLKSSIMVMSYMMKEKNR